MKTNYLLVVVFFLCGAVFAQKKAKLTADVKAEIQKSTVHICRYEAPPLGIMTPKDAAGAGLIANLTDSDEAKENTRHRFYPSARLQQVIDSLFRKNQLISDVDYKQDAYPFTMPAKLKDISKHDEVEAKYIIEVTVPLMGWRATYKPIKWRTYNLNLGCIMRIIRKEDGALVWKGASGYGHMNDKFMTFHIDDLETDAKGLLAAKMEKACLAIGEELVEKYKSAKK